MTEDTYQELLCLVSPLIERQSTVMRNPISWEFTTLISKPSLCKIIPETCKAIYMVLKKFIKFPSTTSEWEDIATDFEDKWNFPHCLGSIDGKHIRIVPPADSGSYYYNYKKTHSIVLMAIANANYEFIYCDVGTNGRISDGGVINNTVFYKRLVEKKLNIPERQPVTNSTRELNYVFVGDEAFAMRPDLLKPFSRATLTNNRRIYNYRLSRARRVIENTFGILASRFRVLYTAINMDVNNIEWVVLACCALHNFLRKQSATYAPPDVFDREYTSEGVTVKGLRCDAEKMHHLQRRSGCKTLEEAKKVQNEFCTYFNGEGSVPWQDKFALDV
ncbi:putative nuclease HARBI1 [Diorhabda carinulata]|uniref:putative nuclease HARBI1 n=1 Tax=Diorhabda carinulata TaxID=1163345 RepID=UPI0025A091B1|nr:putative nuclease HARBI1 [Diorhabda carinulata]